MRINIFENERDTRLRHGDVTFDRFVESLVKPVYTKCAPCKGHDCRAKYGRAWSPTRYHEAADTKGDAGVQAITAAVFDIDQPRNFQMREMAMALRGVSYYCHGTHTVGSYRLIIELTKEVPVDQWEQVWLAMVRQFKVPADEKCSNPHRIYFWPSRPEGGSFENYRGLGLPFNWEGLDFKLTAASDIADRLSELAHEESEKEFEATKPEEPIDMYAMRDSLAKFKDPKQRAVIEPFLSGKALASVGSRDDSVNQLCSLLAFRRGEPISEETLIGLITPCLRAMPLEPEGFEYWLNKARGSYRRALVRREKIDEEKRNLDKAFAELAGDGSDDPNDTWRKELKFQIDKDGVRQGLGKSARNVWLVLEHDPRIKGTLRFNEMTKTIEASEGPFAAAPYGHLDTFIMNWFEHQYNCRMKRHEIREQMLLVALSHRYSPLRDYLASVSEKWDGTPRVERFLVDYLDVDDNEHVRRISKRWFISAAARGLEPGCKVDTVLVLQGGQGAFKSTVFDVLGGEFFTDSHIEIGSKDGMMLAGQFWIAEFAELANMRKADQERVKQFITQRVDSFRLPYSAVTESFPRHCVFVGTTNPEQVLTDDTGNRRWWCVTVGEIDIERVRRDREQLWAEAASLFLAGRSCPKCVATRCDEHRWWLNREENLEAEQHAEPFLGEDPLATAILDWYLRKQPGDRASPVKTAELARDLPGHFPVVFDRRQAQRLGRTLRALGFKHSKVRIGKATLWHYTAPLELQNRPVGTKAQPEYKTE